MAKAAALGAEPEQFESGESGAPHSAPFPGAKPKRFRHPAGLQAEAPPLSALNRRVLKAANQARPTQPLPGSKTEALSAFRRASGRKPPLHSSMNRRDLNVANQARPTQPLPGSDTEALSASQPGFMAKAAVSLKHEPARFERGESGAPHSAPSPGAMPKRFRHSAGLQAEAPPLSALNRRDLNVTNQARLTQPLPGSKTEALSAFRRASGQAPPLSALNRNNLKAANQARPTQPRFRERCRNDLGIPAGLPSEYCRFTQA